MELEPTLQREYKDRLFKAIFGRDTEESKRWRLELYNALNGTDYKDPDALEVNTIENVIYLTMKNDVSFLVDSQMNLYEHQSTFNPNMPLRGLIYFAQLYQMHLSRAGKTLFRSTVVHIPNPNFVVFYNGDTPCPDKFELKLSDAFERRDKSGNFEWTATVININKNSGESIAKTCKPLYNYSQYVARISENKKSGMTVNEAVAEAVDWAIKQNLFDGFFKAQKSEVLAMSLTEFDEEEFRRDMLAEGREEGIEIGAQQKAVEVAVMLVNDFDADPKVAAEKTGAPLEKVLEALAAQPAPAQG